MLAVFAVLSQFELNAQTSCSNSDPTSPVGIVPVYIQNNPDLCPGGYRLDFDTIDVVTPFTDTYLLDAYGNTVTITVTEISCGQIVTWSVSPGIAIDKICVKGGNEANDYDYTGVNPQPVTDGNLHAPLNTNNNNYHDISHIDFCYHYQLTVSKTALAEFTRTYAWSLEKACLGGDLTLSTGQVYGYPFQWTASATYTDSDFGVSGVITIVNNTPFTATIDGISDVLSTLPDPVMINPGVTLPFDLVSDGTLTIIYSVDVPDMVNGTNTVTVSTSTPLVEGNTASAPFVFSAPTTAVDDCATVVDNCMSLVTVCYTATPFTSSYQCFIGPYEVCGAYSYLNGATLTTNTTATEVTASCSVAVNVPCMGCTLTQGYWKTHSELGPAPYDDTWSMLSAGAETPFFGSGKTWFEMFWTPPANNVYYNLAHQYMAAKLNMLNGASSTSVVDGAIAWAENFFTQYSPTNWFKADRKFIILYANKLDSYNNGITGPGHCTEAIEDQEVDYRDAEQPLTFTEKLRVYPNPASDWVNIDLGTFDPNDDLTLTIFNTLGELCLQQHLGGHGGEIVTLPLNPTTFHAGQYAVVVHHANGTAQAVFMVTQ